MDGLEKQRQELLKAARDIAAKAEATGRDFTDDERAQVNDLLAKAKGCTDKIKAAGASRKQLAEIDELLKAGDAQDLNDDVLRGAKAGALAGARKSLGHMVTNSNQYQGLMKSYPNGRIPEKAGVQMPGVSVGGVKGLLTGVDSDTSAGALVEPTRLGLVAYPQVPLALRNVITVGDTDSDAVEYAQALPAGVGGSVSAAAGIAEATASTGTSGIKPESTLKFRKAKASVITVPHWMPATKRALSDAAQVRTLIDGFLRQGVAREIERQMTVGDESTPKGDEEFNGILNTSGVQDQAFSNSIPETARKMMTKVQKVGGQFEAFLMSPETDEALDLLTDTNDRYYGAGPFQSGPKTLWGAPRVIVHDMPAEKIVGGQVSTCVLWDRQDTTISVTDSHADFFIRNLVAVLAEARAAFGVLNPQLLAVGGTVTV